MNISDWYYRESDRFPLPGSLNSSRSWTRVFGLIGTLILHAALVQTVVLGSRAHKLRLPEFQGSGATLIKAGSDPSEPLMLLHLTVIDGRNQQLAVAGRSLPMAAGALRPEIRTLEGRRKVRARVIATQSANRFRLQSTHDKSGKDAQRYQAHVEKKVSKNTLTFLAALNDS